MKFSFYICCSEGNCYHGNNLFAVPPNVTVSSSAGGPVVEGIDSVTLTCASSANPEAELAWRKEGGGRVLGNFPTLDIGVVSRTDMGTYTCTATNALGVSAPEAVDVVTYCKYCALYCLMSIVDWKSYAFKSKTCMRQNTETTMLC